MTESSAFTAKHGPGRRLGAWAARLIYLLPVLLFGVVTGYFLWGLDPERDPSEVPSVLIDKPAPEFSLPPVQGRTLGLSTADLKGEVSLVNVFASWCTACRYEHPLLMRLKADGAVPIHGLNYKDRPEDAAEWLDTLGDPYTRTGADQSGRIGIEWGVYGVPETFVISREGRIMHKHIGPVTEKDLEDAILPLIERLRE
ncbi:MAG: DsbE family thiol:disulfide interchange protein [Paracoccaceae bacterium]